MSSMVTYYKIDYINLQRLSSMQYFMEISIKFQQILDCNHFISIFRTKKIERNYQGNSKITESVGVRAMLNNLLANNAGIRVV